MRARVALQKILGMADDIDGACGAREDKREVQGDWDGAAHLHVTFQRLEALRLNRHVVGIRRKIVEDVLARGISGRRGASLVSP